MRKATLILAVLMLTVGLQAEPLAPRPYEQILGPAPEMIPILEEAEQIVRPDSESPGISIAETNGGDYIGDLTSPEAISTSAEKSLAIVPDWLKMDLYDMFTRMSASDQEDYGQLLLAISDPRLIDEVAFTIAHSSKSVLSRTEPELYLRNVELLYQIDPEIPYADIVDYGEPGVDSDFYSTVRYSTIRGGEMDQYELPRDIYYWFVVHPKLGKEEPSMSPEPRENANTYGYFWREYLFYNPSNEFDYSLNYMTKEPNMIGEADIDGWGPSASGYLVDGTRKCPDGVIVGGSGIEKPLLVEYVWG
ncbi:hypothetical protein J7M28_05760, partial [bacterium]|nr:hypothetical protein [bacterium]